jgi:hypothetical protein
MSIGPILVVELGQRLMTRVSREASLTSAAAEAFGRRVVGQTRPHVGSDAARPRYGCPFGSRKRTPAPVLFDKYDSGSSPRDTAIPGPSRDASTLLQLHPRSTLAG